MKLSVFIIGLLFILFSFNVQGQCPTTNLVENPGQFQWTFHPASATNSEPYYSGVMEVGETTLIMNNGETFTTRAYRQEGTSYSVPGPTINVVPGNKYILSLHNTLPFEALSTSHNVFKDPNAVNIHTHGLHISGESPGDDVTRVFEGGQGGDFVWDIPADHMGGTYWYHAHHHGSSYLQVAGGMLGMLIVDDANDGIPANVAGMEERQLLFAKLDPTASGTGGDVLMGGSLSGATWTTNGVIGGNICMPANTWQHWRVLIADPNAMLRDIEFGPECEVMVLARDGVWRTVAPKELTTNMLKLTGASRADFAIRTTGNSWVKVGGNIMANIYVDGPSDASVHPFDIDGVSNWSAIRPSYLRDLRTETNVNNESVQMGARTVNGSKFDHMTPNYSIPTTQVQEWSLSGNVRHPFHLHIYHVQALADDRDFEAGEFYDVVASQMSIRFDLNQSTTTPYAGKTIMHCHILEHEDQGAMGWMDVQGGQAAPTFPVDANIATPYSEYYTVGSTIVTIPSAATSLSATAVSSSSIDLAWTDNASDEDGFIVERSADGTNFNLIGSIGADVSAYSDNGLNASTLYYYRVIAFNTAGSSVSSNIANATTIATVTIPSAATSLSATATSSSSIDLAWTDNAPDEDGFNVERSADGTNFNLIGSIGADVTAYSDNGLNASTLYYYRVIAFNSAGSSAFSNIANATTLGSAVTIPDAPSSLSATAASNSSIDLAWTDNASDEDGFNVERSADGTNFNLIGSIGADVSTYSDNGLNASTLYYYRVIAFNTAGSSAASNIANATTIATVTIPDAPSSLSATAVSSSSIDLAWADNASDEDGFNVERSADGTNFNLIGSIGADVTAYSDNGLSASTLYYYRVIAFNSAGSSAASNIANATTLSASGGAIIYVENISVTRQAISGNRFRGAATVSIYDNAGLSVAGATVNGDFSGTTSSSESEVTDVNGQITVYSGGKKNPNGEWCFEVTNVSLIGSTYDPLLNFVTIACESTSGAKSNAGGKSNKLKEQPLKNLNVYPNPFNGSTNITFQIAEESDVLLEVYSVNGRKVAMVANQKYEIGQHVINWSSQNLSQGTYFLELRVGNQLETKRLMIIR